MGAAKEEGEHEDGMAALAVNATNTARKADSTRRFWLAGSCESCTQKNIYCNCSERLLLFRATIIYQLVCGPPHSASVEETKANQASR